MTHSCPMKIAPILNGHSKQATIISTLTIFPIRPISSRMFVSTAASMRTDGVCCSSRNCRATGRRREGRKGFLPEQHARWKQVNFIVRPKRGVTNWHANGLIHLAVKNKHERQFPYFRMLMLLRILESNKSLPNWKHVTTMTFGKIILKAAGLHLPLPSSPTRRHGRASRSSAWLPMPSITDSTRSHGRRVSSRRIGTT